MHRLVNEVASSSAARCCLEYDDCSGWLGLSGVGDYMVLAPNVPIEVRVYKKSGAGMGCHVDDVLYRPTPQVEVVYTLENTSDWSHVVADCVSGGGARGVRMSDCCLQGIEPCECKGKGYQWVGNLVFRLGSRKELRKE